MRQVPFVMRQVLRWRHQQPQDLRVRSWCCSCSCCDGCGRHCRRLHFVTCPFSHDTCVQHYLRRFRPCAARGVIWDNLLVKSCCESALHFIAGSEHLLCAAVSRNIILSSANSRTLRYHTINCSVKTRYKPNKRARRCLECNSG